MTATDSSTIESLAGGLSYASSGSIGAALATNDIFNSTTAYLDGSSVAVTGGDVLIGATSTTVITTVAAGGAGGGQFSLGGSVTLNEVTNSITALLTGYDDGNYFLAQGGALTAEVEKRPFDLLVEAFGEYQKDAPLKATYSLFEPDPEKELPPAIEVDPGAYFGIRSRLDLQLGDDAQRGERRIRAGHGGGRRELDRRIGRGLHGPQGGHLDAGGGHPRRQHRRLEALRRGPSGGKPRHSPAIPDLGDHHIRYVE